MMMRIKDDEFLSLANEEKRREKGVDVLIPHHF